MKYLYIFFYIQFFRESFFELLRLTSTELNRSPAPFASLKATARSKALRPTRLPIL